jgi:hypothetical protein
LILVLHIYHSAADRLQIAVAWIRDIGKATGDRAQKGITPRRQQQCGCRRHGLKLAIG